MKILLVCDPRNLLSFHWAYALSQCQHTVSVFSLDSSQIEARQLVLENFQQAGIDVHWSDFNSSGLRKNLAAWLSVNESFSARDHAYIKQFSPDMIVSWWGLSAYSAVKAIIDALGNLPYVPIVSTYPNAYTSLYHTCENLIWNSVSHIASGYVFYSNHMERSFRKKIGIGSHVPSINMIDPQPAFQFSTQAQTHDLAGTLKLQRYDDKPHVIFSGTVKYLSDTRSSRRKDALKTFITALSEEQVHVFTGDTDQLNETRYIHPRAYFPVDRFGTFSAYLSQFDAHIVIYNEFNRITRKRVANGLGTRYSFAQTANCPIAVSASSLSSLEEIKEFGIGFSFDGIDDLSTKLSDSTMLGEIRANILRNRSQLTFESRYQHALADFLKHAALLESFSRHN